MRRHAHDLVAGITALALCCSACSATGGQKLAGDTTSREGLAECVEFPDSCNSGDRAAGGTIRVGLVGSTRRLDPFSQDVDDGQDPTSVVMSMIAPSAFIVTPSGATRYNADLLTEEPTVSGDLQHPTVTYKIRAEAHWWDGMPLSATDFEYTWRMRSGRPQVGDQPPGCSTVYCLVESVTGTDNGKTVTVALSSGTPDWRTLFDSIAPFAVGEQAGGMATAEGLAASREAFGPQSRWSGGPYLVSAFEPGRQVEFIANPSWYGSREPTLAKVVFRFFDDQESALLALERFEINTLELDPDQHTIARMSRLTGSGIDCQPAASHTWTHLDINATRDFLVDPALRTAMFTAIGADEMVDRVIRGILPHAQPRRAHYLFPGQARYRDVLTEAAEHQGSGDVEQAMRLLSESGYRVDGGAVVAPDGRPVPPLRLRYPSAESDPLLVAAADVIRSQWEPLGITVVVEPTEDMAAALAARDYDLLLLQERDGVLRSRMIERWRGAANTTGWTDPHADELLGKALRQMDDVALGDLLNRQDALLTRAAVVLPLYQRPRVLGLALGYVGIRESASGGSLTDQAGEWGIRLVGRDQEASCPAV